MEGLSVEERCEIVCGRIVKLVKENGGKPVMENVAEKYKEKYKIDLEHWKGAFVQFSAFIKYGCSGSGGGSRVFSFKYSLFLLAIFDIPTFNIPIPTLPSLNILSNFPVF